MAEVHSTRREALKKVLVAGPLAALGLLAGASARKAEAADGNFDNLYVTNQAGIGTTSPESGYKLDVDGKTKIGGTQIMFKPYGGTTVANASFIQNGNSAGTRFEVVARDAAGGNWLHALDVDDAGRVGIGGNHSAAYPLDVIGTMRGTTILASDHIAVTGGLYPRIQSDVQDTPLFVGAANPGTGNVLIIAKGDFGNSGNYLATVTNSGDVGIGTTSPQARLDVAGSIKVSGVLEGVSRKAYYDQ